MSPRGEPDAFLLTSERIATSVDWEWDKALSPTVSPLSERRNPSCLQGAE